LKLFIKLFIKLFRNIDSFLNTSIYKYARKIWYISIRIINVIYKIVDRFRIPVLFLFKDKTSIKLHIGCGEQHKEGYFNVDLRKTSATDFVCDIRNMPFPHGSISLIESYHAIEHLSRNDFLNTLGNWYNLLQVGGRLIIECPDFDKAVNEYIKGNEDRIYNIFGYQRFFGDAHLFGYNTKRLTRILQREGFTEIESKRPLDYHTKEEPCLRIEAIKNPKIKEMQ